MLKIDGSIIRGAGDASKNHPVLIPLLAQYFPEVAPCSPFGSINVATDAPFFKSLGEHWTPRIKWRACWLGPNDPDCEEAFGFIRIRFECPLGGPQYRAWVIVPELCLMSYEDDRAEVIAPERIPGVAYGARCAIELDEWPTKLRPLWFGKR